MATLSRTETDFARATGLLDRERIIAKAGFNRWLVPPAALCDSSLHRHGLWLQRVLAAAVARNRHQQVRRMPGYVDPHELLTTSCDWRIASLGWMYTLFFVLLGSSAAIWGGWLERAGPRKAGVVAALCWCGGLVLSHRRDHASALAHVAWLGRDRRRRSWPWLHLAGFDPHKWFPDRRGMATGMAIMGFGGGAMIGAPLANLLMNYFRTPTSSAYGRRSSPWPRSISCS